MVIMISHVSAARRPPRSLPSCFSSISPPERWFQIKQLSLVCVDHGVLAIFAFCECSCFAKIRFPAYFVTWDHHHCVSRHFLLQNDGFKPKNCQQCALITMFVLFLRCVNSHACGTCSFLRGLPSGLTTRLILTRFSHRTVVSRHGVVKMQISTDIEERKILILQIKISHTGFFRRIFRF